MGGLRPLHHRIAQDPGDHRLALPAFQFSLGGFRRPGRAHGVDLRAGRHRGRCRSARRPGRRPAKAACAIRSRRSTRPSPAAAPNSMPPKSARCSAPSRSNRSKRSPRRWPQANRARMLEVVDELERNGHNLQHFSRELSRYFRNLLVARIAGADTAPDRGLARRSARSWRSIAGAVLRRRSHALPAALARSLQGPAILAAAALPPGNRPASGWCRPAACCPSNRRWPDSAPRTAAPRPAQIPQAAPPPAPPPRRPRSCRRVRTVALRTRPRQEGHAPVRNRNRSAPTRWPPSREPAADDRRRPARAAARRAPRKGHAPTWPTPWRMPQFTVTGGELHIVTRRNPTACT